MGTLNSLDCARNAVVFPLQTSTVYSKDPKETFDTLDRMLKNALLFFEEILIEAGVYQVTYGDTFCSAFDLPYKGVEVYKRMRKSYESAGNKKRESWIGITQEGKPEAKMTTVASSPARSFVISLQGALESLLETHSEKELDFVKYIWTKEPQKIKDAVSKVSWEYKRLPNIKDKLNLLCKKWDIGEICASQILQEAINATFLSRACNSPPVIDELHKDVIGSIDNIKKEIHEEQLRIDVLSKVMQIAIPDYSDLTLSKILDLRKEPSLMEFRKAINEITRKLDGITDKESYIAIFQEINKHLIKDVESIAPKGYRSIILSAAADCILSIPLSPEFLVPLLLANLGKTGITGIVDLLKKEKWDKSFGCFWMKMAG